jgi:tetratricopeptide (TPR) repeat protein
MSTPQPPARTARKRRPYVRAVGPRLAKLLSLVFAVFALTSVNSLYLASITFLQWMSGSLYENYFYHLMAFGHVVLGALLTPLVLVFGILHIRNAHDRPNRRAVRAGFALFAMAIVLLVSGFLLVRVQGFAPVKATATRSLVYWIHVVAPLFCAWLFVLHRLAGKKIKWRVGVRWAAVGAVFAIGMVLLHSRSPQEWDVVGPKQGEKYFFPSQARTATGDFIPKEAMLNDRYCLECHADAHATWSESMHRFSSFNNPVYLFSVLNTRKKMFERDGNVHGSRFCAACHDPVPFFGGEFDDPKYDDPDYDLGSDPLAQAGITCTVCHSITKVNSVKGNGSFTIEEARHYPFAYSDNPILKWINKQMILAKPEFHKRTFLKPLHRSPAFCGACHKVHLPPELNAYKWLRGQNHYDSFWLSGVSGHGITSFYYPPVAEQNCNDCHMPLRASDDVAARSFDDSGELKVHDHQFPTANTGVPFLLDRPAWVNERHREFLEGVMRVDVFGVKEGGIDGRLHAPLRPEVPTLEPGKRYLLETVIRTVKMGHHFTQGTADSNEIWLDVTVTDGDGQVIGRNGGLDERGEVDPWSHFVNAFVIDREGHRIDRRNAEDIFIALYNHQIPPGAGQVVHYALDVPEGVRGPLQVDVALKYRKFDTVIMAHVQAEAFTRNDLPIVVLAEDSIRLPLAGDEGRVENKDSPIPTWQRWNDYGIGFLLKAGRSHKGELRQAEAAFAEVEQLGRPDGPLNRARVYLREGRLDEAVEALAQAGAHDPPAPVWSVAWFTGMVDKQNGHLDKAIANFRKIVELDTEETRRRKFDFSNDYRLVNELGQTLFERAKQLRGDPAARERMQREALSWFERALDLDPENVDAHWNLTLIHGALGNETKAAHHRSLHAKYKPDDNARDRAVALARKRYPAANHAADVVVIHDLGRPGAHELPER